MFEKTKINEKEAKDGPFFKKIATLGKNKSLVPFIEGLFLVYG